MAACGTQDVIFSVTINFINKKEESRSCLLKNAIRKFSTLDTWYDVFDKTTEGIEIAQNVLDNFEKAAHVSVQKSMGTETFDASPYDQIKILTDFDPLLKFVTINVESDCTQNSKQDEPSISSADNNAFDVLMSAQTKKRKPSKISDEKPNFTGIGTKKTLIYL